MNSIEIYHYGDCGKFDDDNPFKLFDEKFVKEILCYIGKSAPNSLDINELSKMINIDIDLLSAIVKRMQAIDLIDEKDNLFTINFTMIFEKDLDEIDRFSKTMAREISDSIIKAKDKIYKMANGFRSSKSHSIAELLYHIIGSHILDGLAIDTLSGRGLFKTSKVQKNDRNYILFGFEKSRRVDQFSENILCSCNNYRTENLSFVSFGDAAGDRNDFYRFNRQVSSQINEMKAREETKANYINILEKSNHDMVSKCSSIVKDIINNNNEFTKLNEEDELYAKYLKSFKYLEEDSGLYKVSVPIFYPEDKEIIEVIHDLLMDIILPTLNEKFENAEGKIKISAIEHGVDIKEILNEMWHQVFGNINEELVKLGMIKEPDYFEGEGRYLKAIYMN